MFEFLLFELQLLVSLLLKLFELRLSSFDFFVGGQSLFVLECALFAMLFKCFESIHYRFLSLLTLFLQTSGGILFLLLMFFLECANGLLPSLTSLEFFLLEVKQKLANFLFLLWVVSVVLEI